MQANFILRKEGGWVMVNHKHLLVNCEVKKPLVKEEDLINWLKRVVEVAKMNIVLGPYAHYIAKEGNEGLTGLVGIETSHCSMHIWDKVEIPYLRFDLYSCADFVVEDILNLFEEFEVTDLRWILVDRNGKFLVFERSGFIER